MEVDDKLSTWARIAEQFAEGAILVGNGASSALNEGFRYESLYDVARSRVEHPLSELDAAVFDLLGTRDFEAILGSLKLAREVCRQSGHETGTIDARYSSIRTALLEAVHSVHPEQATIPNERLTSMQDALLRFGEVFTTNYDFILYWAVAADETKMRRRFKDFFWNPKPRLAFDITDTDTPEGKTRVYYLHGGLHLFHIPAGGTVKASGHEGDEDWGTYAPLISLVFDYMGAEFPLFVSEGTSDQKLAAINANSYLAFAFERWSTWWGPLTIFGHSLSPGDDHLVSPLVRRAERTLSLGEELPPIAVSIVARSSAHIIDRKVHYQKRLQRSDILFFNAASHPLGSAPKDE